MQFQCREYKLGIIRRAPGEAVSNSVLGSGVSPSTSHHMTQQEVSRRTPTCVLFGKMLMQTVLNYIT